MNEVIIHVGVHKTGSTSIQRALDQCRGHLEAIGIKLYEGSNHQAFYRAFTDVPESFHRYYRSWKRQPDQASTRAHIKRYFDQYPGYTHVITAEDLSLLSYDALSRMRDFLVQECSVSRIVTVCMLRDPVEYLNSSLQQYIKPGLVALDHLTTNSFPGYQYQGFPGFRGGYEAILQRVLFPVPERLKSVFGAGNVEFFNFEDAREAGLARSVIASATPGRSLSWLQETRANQAMSHEACILLAEYNNRNPLFDRRGRYNHYRNSGNPFIAMLRAIEGRRADLVDASSIDGQWLKEEADKVNAVTGKVTMPTVGRGTERTNGRELLEFSERAVRYIDAKVKSNVVPGCSQAKIFTVGQIEEMNKRLERTMGWKRNMTHAIRRYFPAREAIGDGS